MESSAQADTEDVAAASLDDEVSLGGNIVLSGFSDVDSGSMVILKKIIGNYVKKFSTTTDDFENININLKSVHATEGSQKHEVKVKLLLAGRLHNSEVTDRNIFMTVDKALKKVESSLS